MNRTPLPRTTQPKTPQAPVLMTAARFLRAIYGGQEGGYFEVCYIKGDPGDRYDPDNRATRHSWHRYDPHTLSLVLELVALLAKQHGDVYVSRTCYTRKERSAAYAMPSRAIVTDDAPVDGTYSFTVQTSQQRRHGWFILDQHLPAAEIRELARRGAYALNADKGGWDVEQLVRIPGTRNTKQGSSFPVRWQDGTGRTYSPHELRQQWLAVADSTTPATLDLDLVRRLVGRLERLTVPDRWNNRAVPGWRVLRGDIVPQRENGSGDDTTEMRYIVCSSLVSHGYPDAEIAAWLWHLCSYGTEEQGGKGTRWLLADIARCIGKCRAVYEQKCTAGTWIFKPVRRSEWLYTNNDEPQAPLRPIITHQPRQRGRPVTITADQLLTFYREHKEVRELHGRWQLPMRRKEAAAAFGIALGTLDRLERELKAQGNISRELDTGRQWSFIDLGPVPQLSGRYPINQPTGSQTVPVSAEEVAQQFTPSAAELPIANAQTSIEPPTEKHTPLGTSPAVTGRPSLVGEPRGPSQPLGSGSGVCFSPPADEGPPPPLREMVRWALMALAGAVYRKRVPTIAPLVADVIHDRFGVRHAADRLEWLVRDERTKLGYEAEADRLRSAADTGLWKLRKDRQRKQQRAKDAKKRGEALRWGYDLQVIEGELDRRGLPLERPPVPHKQRKVQSPPLLLNHTTPPPLPAALPHAAATDVIVNWSAMTARTIRIGDGPALETLANTSTTTTPTTGVNRSVSAPSHACDGAVTVMPDGVDVRQEGTGWRAFLAGHQTGLYGSRDAALRAADRGVYKETKTS